MSSDPCALDEPSVEIIVEEAPASAPLTAAPLPATEVGQLGSYRVGERIATGGMATVHVGVSPGPAYRPVAIKRMLPHLAEDEDFVAMFLDEARLSARIQHPNVCAVFDHGVQDLQPYMVMEMLVGQDLSRLTRAVAKEGSEEDRERFPRVGAKLLAEVCEGLHAAHELRGESGRLLGVVHRDVSPHNIFVSAAGAAKIIDFGIAKARMSTHRTATGTVKGKFGYMAPEQLRGEAVDRRADIWSVGVVLWELVTGRRLFARETESATILAVLGADVPRLDEMMDDPPEGLQPVLDRALCADRTERYEDVREMGEDLARFASGAERPVLASEVAALVERYFSDEIARSETLVRSAARRLVTENRAAASQSRVRRRPDRASRGLLVAGMLAVAAAIGLAFVAFSPSPPTTARIEPDRATPPAPSPAATHTTAALSAATQRADTDPTNEEAPAVEAPEAPPTGIVRVRGRGTVVGPDGLLGEAPGRFELPEGRHRLRLEPVRGSARTVHVRVREDESTTVRMRAPRTRPAAEARSPEASPGDGLFHDLDY